MMTRSYIPRSDKPKAAERNMTAIKAFILKNQGAAFNQLCGHIQRTAQIAHAALRGLRLENWLFVQMRGGRAYYYSAAYAIENNLESKIVMLGARSITAPPPVNEVSHLSSMSMLDKLWPVNS